MRTALNKFTWHTMDAMADDWESLDQIMPHMEQWIGIKDRVRVAQLVVELVSEGLLCEMKLVPNQQLTAEMILDMPTKYWFSMTSVGRVLWESEGHKYRD